MPAELKTHNKGEHFSTEDGRYNGYNQMDANQNVISEESDLKTADQLTGCLFDLDQRFFRTACNLVGYVFRVKTSEGRVFEGILETFDPNFDVALSLAHEVQEDREDELPYQAMIKEKMIFSRENIVTLSAIVDADAFTVQKGFATDSEIGRINGEGSMKTLEAWEPDGHADEEDFVDCEDNLSEGWTAEEMFERNKNTFGVVSTFKDNLTQFSNVQIEVDESSAEYRAKLAHADRVAQAILANPASQMAAALENDDEERDIVQRPTPASTATVAATQASTLTAAASKASSPPMTTSSSSTTTAVVRPSAAAATTTSDNVTKVYMPPNKRKSGPNQNRQFNKPVGPFTRADYGSGPSRAPPPFGRPSKMTAGGGASPDEPSPAPSPHQTSPGYHGNAGSGAIQSAVYSRSRYGPQTQGGGGGQPPQSPMQYQAPNEWERHNQAPYNKRATNANSPGNFSKPPFGGPQTVAGEKRFTPKSQRDRDQNMAELRKFSNEFQLVPPSSTTGGGVSMPPTSAGAPPVIYSHPPPPQRRPSPPGATPTTTTATVMTSAAPPPSSSSSSGGYKHQQRSPPRNQHQHHAPHQGPKYKTTHNEPLPQRFISTAVPPPPLTSAVAVAATTPRPQTLSAGGGVVNPPPPSPSSLPSGGSDVAAAAGVSSAATQPPASMPTSHSTAKPEITESTVKSKLNPEAKEFCPSSAHSQPFYRPTPVQTPVGAPGTYPAAVQSPGSQPVPILMSGPGTAGVLAPHPPQPIALQYPPQQSSSPQLPPNGGNGSGNGDYGNGNGAPVVYQSMVGGAGAQTATGAPPTGAALYPQPPPLTGPPPPASISTFSAVPLLSGTSPVYTISQPALAILHSNNGTAATLRPYKVTAAGAQPAAAVATAATQPIIATAPFPGNAGASFLVQYPNAALQQGALPQPQAFQPAQYFISTAPRMQYVLPQGAVPPSGDNGQQQVYTMAHAPSASNAVAGQPVITAPYAPGQPYVLQYTAVPSQLVLGQTPQGAALAYQPSQCVFGAPQRMPYLLPQQPGQQVENNQQQVYAVASFPQTGYPPVVRSASMNTYNQQSIGPSATPGNHSNA